jgi:hypothetical protein
MAFTPGAARTARLPGCVIENEIPCVRRTTVHKKSPVCAFLVCFCGQCFAYQIRPPQLADGEFDD